MPGSKAQHTEILDELHRILSDAKFNASKRCAALLRYLVEHTLDGDPEGFKERSLGIEVFGRETGYDNIADPIVRTTATEIRKRLAHYYQESEEQHPVKIRLPVGSYHPVFEFEAEKPSAAHAERVKDKTDAKPFWKRGWLWVSLASLLLLLGMAGAFYGRPHSRSGQYLLWDPILSSSKDIVILCISDDAVLTDDTAGTEQARRAAGIIATQQVTFPVLVSDATAHIRYSDVVVAHRISNLLVSKFQKNAILLRASEVTRRDFNRGPILLIGELNNPWTLSLLSSLRFSAHIDPVTQERWIMDAHDPSKREWKASFEPGSRSYDYALITRYHDSDAGNWIMAVGSLTNQGTTTAATLLTDPSISSTLAKILGTKENFQLVLKIDFSAGKIIAPKIVASYAW